MKTSETLNKAADLIEERGWVQGGATDGPEDAWGMSGGPVCLEGAIIAALGLKEKWPLYECRAHDAVAEYLERNPRPTCGPIEDALWQWNDARGRTASEVIEVLRACALIEAAREEQDAAWETYAEVVSA